MPVTFTNKLITNNLDVENLFNNVNVTETIENIRSLAIVNNYVDNYAKLYEIANQTRSSLTR